MNSNVNFECFFNNKSAQLSCDQYCLEVKTKTENLRFLISLKLHFQWIYFESQIHEVRFQNCSLVGSAENLEKLKSILDCKVMYLGAAEMYEQYLLIKEDEQRKAMIVKSILNGQKYFCKVYKKEVKENEKKFLNEVKILRMLRENKNVVKILEVYESQHNYYMIMEYLKHKLEQYYTHEENQIIIKEILNILDDLNNKFIVHGQISQRSFMFDKGNVVKLIKFSEAKILDQVDGLDMFDLHKVVLYLNGLSPNTVDFANGIYPEIASHGTNFLKSLLNSTQYRINIKQALSHPFLQCVEKDHQIARAEMNLKFKHSFNNFQ
ncbi:unnamed protein product [Paramecium octaurelia]|uniref:Protein kinase domain-containing protein n=1 Tax=Paramecium octaurelia TaxID=43137 RepID=A0A8S1WWU0_PAROT|nr:unnamed protein product [Paramecium octaurelia]